MPLRGSLRTLARIAASVVGGVAVLVLSLIAIAEVRWDRMFTAPLPAITASRDTGVIARGRYLVYGPAHCVDCHRAPEDVAHPTPGILPPLVGGQAFRLPPGTFYVANITRDSETGIGRASDGQLARMLRHGVRPNGRAAMPFMAYQNLSDEDLTAVVSFLRAQPAVRHVVPPDEVNLLGRIVLAFVIKPQGPKVPPPARTPPLDSLAASGRYLVEAVAECAGCHTQRNFVTGAFIGPRLAGGAVFSVDDDPRLVFVTPNLTPDSATGRIAQWSEQQFLARFRAGTLIPQSVMPWTAFGRMTDGDLQAIYRFLRTVAPVHYDPGPSLRPTHAKGG